MRRLAATVVTIALGCSGGTSAPAPVARTDDPAGATAAAAPSDARAAVAATVVAAVAPTVAATVVAPGAPVTAIEPPCPKVTPRPPPPLDRMRFAAATWADLPAWADDRHAAAAAAFARSCPKLAELADAAWVGLDRRFGRARQWRRACAAVADLPAGDDAAARGFFEREFAPWQVAGKRGPVGKMTAYFVQPLRASRTRHDQYQYPIYRRPPELVMIDWSKCSPTGRGRKQWGRLDPATHALVPLPTRAEIRAGAFAGRDLELLWVDDPVDELFLRIEGSGRATLDDGTEVWVEYDGKNGQPYTGPARLLRARGELPRGQGTMAGIRAAFTAHGDGMHEIIDGDASMVFFKLGDRAGAIGSQDVILTPQRSAAVDRNFIAASTPLWIDTDAPRVNARGTEPWRHLVVAQDTGGNIKGAVRADLYWGPDAADGDVAGHLGGKGQYWALLPRAVKPR
ncbi:MAG: murein transglycosylase A [Myxococcales bacterium]|nr:murein transglycosylase A [Myxococcales bacterium]